MIRAALVVGLIFLSQCVFSQTSEEVEARIATAKKRNSELEALDRQISSELQDQFLKRGIRKRVLPLKNRNEFSDYIDRCALWMRAYGNINYPTEAQGKLYGKGYFQIELAQSGALIKAKISSSSGAKVLDDAVLDAVKLASPYPPFPPELAKDWDSLLIHLPFSYFSDGNE